jgi:2,3-dihydroxybenzoate-AMP ligase
MFDAYIAYQARQQPGAIAVATPAATMSFAELDAMVNRFARALSRIGLPADGIVAVQFANPITHWLAILGLARLGIGSACGSDGSASFLVTDQPSRPGSFLASDAWIEQTSRGSPAPLPAVRPDPNRLGRVLLSSGTTGAQKRIGLSWGLIDANIRNAVIAYGPTHPGPWLLEIGIDTVFGFTVGLAGWAAGHGAVFRTGADLPALLTRFAPGLFALVPIQLHALLERLSPGFKPLGTMRAVVTGGLLPPAMAREARLRLTPDIRIVYGASECGAATILDAAVLDGHPGAVGYPMPGVAVETVNEAGEPAPPGQPGEVRIRSNRVAAGYLEEPEGGQRAFRNGWFHPGDIGRLAEDGLLLIDGRVDDLMNLGGPKVLPGVVEDALEGCPGVLDAAAFAIPHAVGIGQCCVALVRGPEFDRDVMVAQLTERLPWLPSVRLLFVDRIPRNAMGKVERNALAALTQASN